MTDFNTSPYEQALSCYNTQLNADEVAAKVETIIRQNVALHNTSEIKKFIFNCIELTSLNTSDSEESILKLTERVNAFDDEYPMVGHVAALCVYPCFANIVSQSLEVEGVGLTCVSGNFPSGQASLDVKTVETALAVKDGATEIDIVFPIGRYLAGDYETLCDEIMEMKAACGKAPLKVILETGLLPSPTDIMKASLLAMYSGADFLKTSTGKIETGASPEAAYVICKAIRAYHEQTGVKIGFKAAGGIRSVYDTLTYYSIAKEVLGEEWLTTSLFRIGASGLANILLADLLGEKKIYF